MEELNRIKRQLQHVHAQRNSPNDLKRRNNTNAGTQSGKRLIQRVLFAAKRASECSVTCHGKHPIHEEKSPCKKSECMRSVVQDVVPEIYVDSDVDGVCYVCGPRRKSLNNGSD